MQLILPDNTASARLILDAPESLTEEAYLSFCEANPDLRLERTAKGEIVIVPPAGGESDYRSLEIAAELRAWAKRDARGVAFGSRLQFLLPDGAALSPNAWLSNEKLDGDAQTIYIYRAAQPLETCPGMATLTADGPLLGFTINLADLGAGL